MRRLIIGVYNLIYNITGAKLLALVIALLYITTLNMVMLNGAGQLLKDWLPMAGRIAMLFRFPFYIGTFLLLLGGAYWLTPPMSQITKEAKKETSYTFLIVYTLLCGLVLLYVKMIDKIF